MSNWKHAYGWSGHILTSSNERDGDPDDNVIAIPPDIFERLVRDHEQIKTDPRISSKVIGYEHGPEDVQFLATGSGFSEGFRHFGTVFIEAEARALPGPPAIDHDREYLAAMKEIYGLTLPPCRLMIGCATEH